MAIVSVTQLKPGEKISQDVLTQKNNLLLNKGTVLTEREIEILKAFLIAKVYVDSEGGSNEQPNQEPLTGSHENASASILAFLEAYDQMFVLLKRVFTLASSSGTIPALEIGTISFC